MGVIVERLKGSLEEKGKEIVAYREKHNIRIQGEPADTKPDPDPDQSRSGAQSSGILVS